MPRSYEPLRIRRRATPLPPDISATAAPVRSDSRAVSRNLSSASFRQRYQDTSVRWSWGGRISPPVHRPHVRRNPRDRKRHWEERDRLFRQPSYVLPKVLVRKSVALAKESDGSAAGNTPRIGYHRSYVTINECRSRWLRAHD